MRELLPIFRSEAQAKLLTALYLAREGRSLSELSRDTGVPVPTVHREIDRLERAGLTRSVRIGNVRRVSTNDESPYDRDLRSLVLKAFGPRALLTDALADLPGVSASYVFGSWARRYLGEQGEAPADIDLVVVGDPAPDAIHRAVRSVEGRLGRPVNVAILSEDEWQAPEREFLRAVREGPLVPLTGEAE